MAIIKYIALIFVAECIGLVFCAVCPSPETLNPCICEHNEELETANIICASKNATAFDLSSKFQQIAEALLMQEEPDLNFDIFNLSHPGVNEIPENVFHGVRFKNIIFDKTTNITRLHPNAFSLMGSFVNEVRFNGHIRLGTNVTRVQEFFDALSKLVNLETISLNDHDIMAVPTKAFRNLTSVQTKLKNIDFNYFYEARLKMTSISDYAFYDLPDIRNIYLGLHSINYISAHSFHLKYPSEETLYIDLSVNYLNASSFAYSAFTNVHRPLILHLRYNDIEYLDEKIFGPILALNHKNKIDMDGNPLVCDCRMAWLINDRNVYTESQLVNALCKSNKTVNIWTLHESDFKC